MLISNMLEIPFKLNITHIKLIPCYDSEYGNVLRVMAPGNDMESFDRTWTRLEYDQFFKQIRFKCPDNLFRYIGEEFDMYTDPFGCENEVGRIRLVGKSIKLPDDNLTHTEYEPILTKDGRFQISLAYMRKLFPNGITGELHIKHPSVINGDIVVSIFNRENLASNESVFNLRKSIYRLSTRPIKHLLSVFEKRLPGFKILTCESNSKFAILHFKEVGIVDERCIKGNGRRVLGIRERARRARRNRNEVKRVGQIDRGEEDLFDIDRGGWVSWCGFKRPCI